MPFAAVMVLIVLIGLSGRRASRGAYWTVAVAAALASTWQYFR